MSPHHFNATYKDVTSVPLPKKTSTYQPVGNQQLIEQLRSQIQSGGHQIVGEQYKLNKTGQQMFGYFLIGSKDEECWRQIGFRNSYDKSRSLGVATGAAVRRCENLEIADFRRVRMHTSRVHEDLEEITAEAVDAMEEDFQQIKADHTYLKHTAIDDDETIAHLVGELFYSEQMINSTQLNLINRSTRDEERLFETDSMYGFYMHLTQALKSTHPNSIIDRHIDAREWAVDRSMELRGSEVPELTDTFKA